MTDTAPDTGTDTTDDTKPDVTDTDTTDWKAEAEKAKALQRKWEDRAKANSTAAKELEDLKKATMTDLEKAVAEAKAAGRAEALAESGSKVVAAEFRAASAGRIEADALATILDDLNLSKFVTEDGDVDAARVAAFVDGIAPEHETTTAPDLLAALDLGQGKRSANDPSHMALNGDPLLKSVMDKVGPRHPR